ncbi:L-fuculose-phosphate aldolase [Pseudovibrio denitrificans]|uniref:L-fuculose-phosphate aldolase n=1 Tax=Pseudovibrio denitrificans TaxID=258256 RepID=A0A1I6YAQ5_9HYPH|nr:class II aldolase/adducin family protein [Pseudovibrio denitrificans]SFT47558.1 L-fuculose-phosphate aldolase [Pseudovibrio denitrificans]
MTTAENQLRREIIETARALQSTGLTHGTSGNVSARCNNGMLITPSGVPYEDLEVEKIVFMDLEGGYYGDFLPSSEWRMHLDIYRTYEAAEAVVHCHSPRATALSTHNRGIPAFHYMVAVAGGDEIKCADYATFGTKALSDAMIAALEDRRACLLAHHGQIAYGPSLNKAFGLAGEVEALADQYLSALVLGEPAPLSPTEMKEILRKFRSYGKQLDALDGDDAGAFEMPQRRD